MKIFYREVDTSYGKPTPSEIGSFIGRLLGKILLLGGGFALGQILRGALRAFGIVLPSLF